MRGRAAVYVVGQEGVRTMDGVQARDVVTRSARPQQRGIAALYGGVTPEQPEDTTAEPTPCDLVGLYTARTAERLCGLRGVIHEHRAAGPLTLGVPGPRPAGSSQVYIGEVLHIGRGTTEHRIAVWEQRRERRSVRIASRPVVAAPSPAVIDEPVPEIRPAPPVFLPQHPRPRPIAGRRKVAAAAFAALIVIFAAAGGGMAQGRYEVREGDTLSSVASTFGVDPDAIAAASYMPNGPMLSVGQTIIIPDPGQGPSDAAAMAARLEGTSPWVVGAHVVQAGDTVAGIGAAWGVGPVALAEFNGIADVENLAIGARLLIPMTPQNSGGGVALPGPGVLVPGNDGVYIPVGTHIQSRNLSCEYAASYIATSFYGRGVPESTFIGSVPAAKNPHYGYRGNIDGYWGNTTDYGVYPEALAPVLAENGYYASIFYSFGETEEILWHLDEGRPVLVWLGLWGDTAETMTDDGTYTVAAGAHVVVAYGYDASGIYVSDPADGIQKFYAWDDFRAKWGVLDGMAMAVSPL